MRNFYLKFDCLYSNSCQTFNRWVANQLDTPKAKQKRSWVFRGGVTPGSYHTGWHQTPATPLPYYSVNFQFRQFHVQNWGCGALLLCYPNIMFLFICFPGEIKIHNYINLVSHTVTISRFCDLEVFFSINLRHSLNFKSWLLLINRFTTASQFCIWSHWQDGGLL